ncbi:ribosomal RNA-processing protein 7 A [Caerostris extrusa]|uniref:Ribosomal RNA-processing protein 7 A n=1 Tax=Caerostris extrusa TaxID=172846 RepID=A0AAV4WKS2_CAEEX|nr:ribosomal RNA-processing protein 7 A [Caerostris extrusa]
MPECVDKFYPFSYNLEGSSINRYCFVKKHEGSGDIKPEDRTLYVINVPHFFNKKSLEDLFKEFGTIERIFIHMKPTGGEELSVNSKSLVLKPRVLESGCKVAYVVFKLPKSLSKIFKFKENKVLPRHLIDNNAGKNKWTQDYNKSFVSAYELKKEITNYMTDYDKKLEEEKQKELEGEQGEEGWITVSKYSKKPKIPRNEAVNKKIIAKRNAAHSRLSLLKFYKSQLREAKMDEILELRKKFEKDKAKISLMRSNRKFKPF